MENYKLTHGIHFMGGKQYKVGDIIKSERNLAKALPDKFTTVREEVVYVQVPVPVEDSAKPPEATEKAIGAEQPIEEENNEEVAKPAKPKGRPKKTVLLRNKTAQE